MCQKIEQLQPLSQLKKKTESIVILEKELAVINARLAMVERLQWVIVAGVVGLLIKSFI